MPTVRTAVAAPTAQSQVGHLFWVLAGACAVIAGLLPNLSNIPEPWLTLIATVFAMLVALFTLLSNSIDSVTGSVIGSPGWVAHALIFTNGILGLFNAWLPKFACSPVLTSHCLQPGGVTAIVGIIAAIVAVLTYLANVMLPAGTATVLARIRTNRLVVR